MKNLKDIVEIPMYATNEITMEKFFGDKIDEVKAKFAMLNYNAAEQIVKISDYNRIAKLYGIEQYELKDDEFIVLCDFDGMTAVRNMALNDGNHKLTIAGKEYKSKYNECKSGFVVMSTSHTNTGIILVPDNCPLTEEMKEMVFLAGNFNADTDEEKRKKYKRCLKVEIQVLYKA